MLKIKIGNEISSLQNESLFLKQSLKHYVVSDTPQNLFLPNLFSLTIWV